MRYLRLTVTTVALALAGAVLAPSADASSTGAKSACSFLKASDVKAVIAKDVKKGRKPAGPPSARVCGYSVVGEVGQSVNVWVQQDATSSVAYKAAKTAFKDDIESISGLGKKAFYVTAPLNTAYVLRGDTLVYVQYVAIGNDDAAAIKDEVGQLTKIVVQHT